METATITPNDSVVTEPQAAPAVTNHKDAFIQAVRNKVARTGPDTKGMVTLLSRMQGMGSGMSELADGIKSQFAVESDAIAFEVLDGDESALNETASGSTGPALLALVAGGKHDWEA